MTEGTPARIKKPITEATVGELRDFAIIDMGLDDVKPGDKRETIIAKLAQAGYNIPTITIANPEAVIAPKEASAIGGQRRPGKNPGDPDDIRIMLHKTDKAGGSRPVPVGVNGRIMLIPRGEQVWVPEPYVQVLKNAVELQYPPYDSDGDFLGGLKEPEEVPAYPFSYA
jgi:hypothetical protein